MRFCGTGIARSRGCASRHDAAPGVDALRRGRAAGAAAARPGAFPCFASGERTVHTDGHVEVGGAFYPVPLALLGQKVRVRWDAHLVASSPTTRSSPCTLACATACMRRAGEAEASTRQQAFVDRLVGQCERVGPALKQWADAALAARGVRAIRLIQGVLSLTRKHPRERVLAAIAEAHAQRPLSDHSPGSSSARPCVPAPTLRTDDRRFAR